MAMASFLIIPLCMALVAIAIKPLGSYMAKVYNQERIWLEKPLGWLELAIYQLCRIDAREEMRWQTYAASVLALGLFGFILLFSLFSLQDILPFNPRGFAGLAPDIAFNAAISFVTNTNWQSYSSETTLSHLSQMAGITVQQFLSAATGMAVAVALFRSMARKQAQTIGNAYADIVRGILYILLPLSLVFSLLLAAQGVVQTFDATVAYQPLENSVLQTQGSAHSTASSLPDLQPQKPTIALGPVASQTAIKMLGSNGGGFFNANSAHPYENPTWFSNLLELVAILLIPAAFVYSFGVMIGDRRQSWSLLAAMTMVFVPLALATAYGEQSGNPRFDATTIEQSAGNMEGKEVRHGAASSAFWAVATTATSNGSVNAMHGSFLPLTGMVPMLLIQFGEVIYGGVGSGAFGMLVYVLLTVFIGGLMVGRTPEYLGKKLGPFEIKMASLFILIPATLILAGTAIAVSTEAGRVGILNHGPQGFSEVLYAFASAANNNGSAFAGLSSNTPFYNIALGVCMFVGRYWLIVPILAIAGSLAAKNAVPPSPGTLPTHTPLFTVMLVGVIVLIDVLTYVPSLALGPIAEHLHLTASTPAQVIGEPAGAAP